MAVSLKLLAKLLLCQSLVLTFALPPAIAVGEIQLDRPLAITGLFGVNQTLQVNIPNDSELSASFKWFHNDVEISGETSETLITKVSDIDKLVSVEITLSRPNFNSKIVKIDAPGPIRDVYFSPQGSNEPYCRDIRPRDGSNPLIGWNLYFYCQDLNTNQGTTGDRSFTWFRGEDIVQNSSNSLYRISPEDVGKKISALYLRTWPSGLQWQWFDDFEQPIQRFVSLDTPVITGVQEVGQTLSVRANVQINATLTYQWYRDFWPITNATESTYEVTPDDLESRLQVLVTASVNGEVEYSRLSEPLSQDSRDYAAEVLDELNSKVTNANPTTNIEFIKSDGYPQAKFDLNQTLLYRAADFWSKDFQPENALAFYFTKDEVEWADSYLDERFSNISISLSNQLQTYNCPYATASYFESIDLYLFVQCGNADDSDNLIYRHITPHEYTHWVQYSIQPSLYTSATRWLVEGQAQFYGLAISELGDAPDMEMINWHLANQSFNFDRAMQLPDGTLRLLDILQAGNRQEIELVLNRGGSVHEWYFLGQLMSEFLVMKFGHDTYWQWTKERLRLREFLNTVDQVVVEEVTREYLGVEWEEVVAAAIPYLALRAQEVQDNYDRRNVQFQRPPVPTLVSVTPKPGAALINWNSNITNEPENYDYTIAWDNGQSICRVSPCLVRDLNNNQKYDFRIQARNQNGYSDWSNMMSVTPHKAPSPPTSIALKKLPQRSLQIIMKGYSTSTSPISKVEYSIKAKASAKFSAWRYIGVSRKLVLKNLSNKTSYWIKFRISNSAGRSVSKVFKVKYS